MKDPGINKNYPAESEKGEEDASALVCKLMERVMGSGGEKKQQKCTAENWQRKRSHLERNFSLLYVLSAETNFGFESQVVGVEHRAHQ